MADSRAVLELIVEFEQALENVEKFGVGGEKGIDRVKTATAELREELEKTEMDLGDVQAKGQDFASSLEDLAGSTQGAKREVVDLDRSFKTTGVDMVDLTAKLAVGGAALFAFQKAAGKVTDGLGEFLSRLGASDETVSRFTEGLKAQFSFNPFGRFTAGATAWVNSLDEGEASLRKASEAGVPFAGALADIAGQLRDLTQEQILSNEELERYNANLEKGEAFLERRKAALDAVRVSVVGDVEGLRLQAGAIQDLEAELESSGKLSEGRLDRLSQSAAKLRDEMVKLGVEVPPRISELADAYDAAQANTEALAEASKDAGEQVGGLAEKATEAASAERELAEAGGAAAESQRQLSEDAERALTILDRLAAARESGADQPDRAAPDAAGGGDPGIAAQKVEDLRTEYEELQSAVTLTAAQQNRLDSISQELQAAQIALRESGAGAAESIASVGDSAATAEPQVAFFGAGTAEAAQIVGELADQAALAESTQRTYAEQLVEGTEALRDQTVAGGDLQANTAALRDTTADLALAESLGLGISKELAEANRAGAERVAEKTEVIKDAEGNVIGLRNAEDRAARTSRDLADAQEELAESLDEGTAGLEKQEESAKNITEKLDDMLERLAKLEKVTLEGWIKALDSAEGKFDSLITKCERLADCIEKARAG